jgi:hypothetical protein
MVRRLPGQPARVRDELLRDDRDGVGGEPVPDATEPDETSVRDLGGERLAVADREERVVLAVQHERRRGDLAEALAPARAVVGEGDVGPRALDVGGAGNLGLGVSPGGGLVKRARPGECPGLQDKVVDYGSLV